MLLNNFLYSRSLNRNEQIHNRKSFLSLIPKTTIREMNNNPLKDEEYQEEIKMIHIGGRSRKERELEKENEGLKEKQEELDKENEELEKEKEELEDDVYNLEYKGKEEGEEDEDNECENELEELKDDLQELTDELEEKENESEELKDELTNLEELKSEKKDDKFISHQFNNRKIEFDNITKEGGLSPNKDIKNVVVSFF